VDISNCRCSILLLYCKKKSLISDSTAKAAGAAAGESAVNTAINKVLSIISPSQRTQSYGYESILQGATKYLSSFDNLLGGWSSSGNSEVIAGTDYSSTSTDSYTA